MPRTAVSSLVRRAFAARRPLDVTSSSSSPSSCCRMLLPTSSHTKTASGAGLGCCSLQHQQRAGLSTLRRGLTGPLSSRLRLPLRGLEEFRDPEIVKAGDVPIVGRQWTVPELRRKSFEDLHKLWFVLYKEKNMLMSELALTRRSKVPIPAGDRRQKVSVNMSMQWLVSV
ncbi:unnamed protein product [Laminaria digitata]